MAKMHDTFQLTRSHGDKMHQDPLTISHDCRRLSFTFPLSAYLVYSGVRHVGSRERELMRRPLSSGSSDLPKVQWQSTMCVGRELYTAERSAVCVQLERCGRGDAGDTPRLSHHGCASWQFVRHSCAHSCLVGARKFVTSRRNRSVAPHVTRPLWVNRQ